MNDAITKFLEILQADENVLGVVLFGSWARGNYRENSDVDLLVLLQHGYKRAIEEKYGQIFEIIYITPDAALAYYTSHLDNAANLWAVAKILYSKENTVENLHDKVNEILVKGKPKISISQRKQLLFDKQDKLKYIKSTYEEDPTTSSLILFNTVSELTEVFFDLKQIWTPAPKQRLQCINEMNHILAAQLSEFYSESTMTKRRWVLLEEMTKLVFS